MKLLGFRFWMEMVDEVFTYKFHVVGLNNGCVLLRNNKCWYGYYCKISSLLWHFCGWGCKTVNWTWLVSIQLFCYFLKFLCRLSLEISLKNWIILENLAILLKILRIPFANGIKKVQSWILMALWATQRFLTGSDRTWKYQENLTFKLFLQQKWLLSRSKFIEFAVIKLNKAPAS